MPTVWDAVYKRLLQWHASKNLEESARPPVPLILGGRPFSSSSDKHRRWIETVEWAEKHECLHLVRVSDAEFETWDIDVPPWNPTIEA